MLLDSVYYQQFYIYLPLQEICILSIFDPAIADMIIEILHLQRVINENIYNTSNSKFNLKILNKIRDINSSLKKTME